MQMRIVRGNVKPGSWADYERTYKEVMGKLGSVPGLQARWLARDTEHPDSGYSVSVWQSEQALRDYEQSKSLREMVMPALEKFFSGDFTVSHCEVVHADKIGP